jgi:cytochrome c-type biogenesis protein CcmF
VLIFLGFAGQGFNQEEEARLKPGQQVQVGSFLVRNDALKITDDGQKQMATAHLTIFENGKELTKMYPAKWWYRKHENSPTSEVAIRRGFAEDLYIVLPAFDASTQTVSLAVHVNPLVNWVWFGFGLMAFGTGVALLPETAFAFAAARVPAGAVTTSIVLLLLAFAPALVFAEGQTVQATPRSQVRRQLESEIMCTCGCRMPMGSCQMRPNCSHYDTQSTRLDQLLAHGDSPDAVKAAFVQEFGGQDVLAAPIDKGFNRLAWAVPYLAGLFVFGAVILTARRWGRSDAAGAGEQPIDATLDARLDDELRNLD